MSLLYLFHRLHRHALSFDLDPPTIFLSYYILHSSRAFSIDIILSRFKFSTKEVYSYLRARSINTRRVEEGDETRRG